MSDPKIKDQVELIISDVEKLSNKKIVNREDLSRILEIALLNKKIDVVEKIAFQGKYIQGLLNIIKSIDERFDEDYFQKVKTEYSDSLIKMKDLTEKLLSEGDDFFKNIFIEKYFTLSQNSLENLNTLCEDFGLIKNFLNDQKRKS